jgi:hypothetical protein
MGKQRDALALKRPPQFRFGQEAIETGFHARVGGGS